MARVRNTTTGVVFQATDALLKLAKTRKDLEVIGDEPGGGDDDGGEKSLADQVQSARSKKDVQELMREGLGVEIEEGKLDEMKEAALAAIAENEG